MRSAWFFGHFAAAQLGLPLAVLDGDGSPASPVVAHMRFVSMRVYVADGRQVR